jgi:hypothetical protein
VQANCRDNLKIWLIRDSACWAETDSPENLKIELLPQARGLGTAHTDGQLLGRFTSESESMETFPGETDQAHDFFDACKHALKDDCCLGPLDFIDPFSQRRLSALNIGRYPLKQKEVTLCTSRRHMEQAALSGVCILGHARIFVLGK